MCSRIGPLLVPGPASYSDVTITLAPTRYANLHKFFYLATKPILLQTPSAKVGLPVGGKAELGEALLHSHNGTTNTKRTSENSETPPPTPIRTLLTQLKKLQRKTLLLLPLL